jgi:hypothetical protein
MSVLAKTQRVPGPLKTWQAGGYHLRLEVLEVARFAHHVLPRQDREAIADFLDTLDFLQWACHTSNDDEGGWTTDLVRLAEVGLQARTVLGVKLTR